MFSDLRLAFRQLRQHPVFSLVAVLTLAIGIGANTALFSVVDGVLLRPLPFPEHERIVTLWESNRPLGIEQARTSPMTFAEWRAQARGLEALAFWTGPEEYNYVTADGVEKRRTSYVSSGVFPVLRINPLLGRGFLPEDDVPKGPQVAVISHTLWQQRFGGDPQVLGRTLTVDSYGKRTYTVVGVMPEGFGFPEATELWFAAGWNGLPQDRRGGAWINVLGRLAPGATVEQVQGDLSAVQARIARENANVRLGNEVRAVPLLRQTVGGRIRTALLVLWAAVGGVLLIACANVANLMLARATARRKEIAVRLALGAGRGRIVRQLLTESVLLAGLGGGAGLLLAAWGVRAIVAWSPGGIARLAEVSVDGTALAFTAGAALLTGVVFGLTPAWQCSRPDVNEALKAAGSSVSAGRAVGRTRSALVVAEVALATVLLVVAGLMLQSFARLVSAERGFRAEKLLTAELDFSVSGFTTWVEATATRPQVSIQRLLERVRGLPGVQAAGASYAFPVLRRDNAPPNNVLSILGRPAGPGDPAATAFEKAISPGFVAALGMQLVRGRDVQESDGLNAPKVALVNEAFARRFFPGEDPVGKYLAPGRTEQPLNAVDSRGFAIWTQIVGVVTDVKSLSTQPDAAPEVYRPYWQWPMQSPILFVRTAGDAALLADALRREAKATVPNLPPPKIRLMTDRVGESIAQPRFQAALLNLFSGIGLLLAACGIYGVLAYTVAQRTREIGIRLALGAQKSDVIALVLAQGLKLTVAGIALGLIGAAIATRALRAQLYEVQPLDPLTFVLVSAGLLLVAAAACWLPARAATKVDPLVALRAE